MKAGQMVDVFARDREGKHVMKSMRWGLVPSHFTGFPDEWMGETTHARIETVHELPSYRESWARKWRVLFPMHYYTQKAPAGPDLFGATSKDVRLKIGRSDEKPMLVAGIYSARQRGSGLFLSCALLTRAASPGLEHIHDRFPVMIEPEQSAAWLDGADNLDLTIPPTDDLFLITAAA